MAYKTQQEKEERISQRLDAKEQARRQETKSEKKDIYAATLEQVLAHREDKYMKRFFWIAGTTLIVGGILWTLPQVFNSSAKIVRSFKNLTKAIKE